MAKINEKRKCDDMPPTTSKEWFKLVILVFVLFIAASSLVLFFPQERRKRVEKDSGGKIVLDIEGKKEGDPDKPQKPFVEDPSALEDINDDQYLQTSPFFYLLHQITSLSQEQIAAAVDPKLGWKNFLRPQDRQLIRGKFMTIRGSLVRLQKEYLSGKIAEERGMNGLPFWRGVLFTADSRLYLFAITDFPEGIRYGDVVELKAAFFKVLVYDTVQGKKSHAPFLIGKTLRILPYVEPEGPRWMTILFLAVFAVTGVLLGMAVYFERREAQSFWKSHRDRQQQRHKKEFEKKRAGESPANQEEKGAENSGEKESEE